MSITDGLRKAFDDCTVMAGVEDKFECVYITKAAALKLLDEVDEAIAATLGRGTCELEINTDMAAILCSKCGYVLPKGTNLMVVRYCAGCGRKVVAE